MKGISFMIAALCTGFSACAQPADKINPVVVELYTSEGCSSCPPAEKVQRELQQLYAKEGLPVYFLSFHVDYWNHLGWKDPYSKAEFSARQYAYAHARGTTGVYTPQAIVNGQSELAGSEQERLEALIKKSYTAGAISTLSCRRLVNKDSAQIHIGYSITGVQANLVLNLAFVETDVTNAVKRGENSGRSLRHTNVVLELVTQTITKDTGEITLKPGFVVRPGKYKLVAYLQHTDDMQVVAAQEITLF